MCVRGCSSYLPRHRLQPSAPATGRRKPPGGPGGGGGRPSSFPRKEAPGGSSDRMRGDAPSPVAGDFPGQGEEQEDRGREETEEHPSRRHVARVPAWSCGKARQRPLEEGFVLLAQGPSKYQTLPGAHSGVAERSLITSEVSEEWGGERWDSLLSALLSFISPTVGTSQPKGDSAVTPV